MRVGGLGLRLELGFRVRGLGLVGVRVRVWNNGDKV